MGGPIGRRLDLYSGVKKFLANSAIYAQCTLAKRAAANVNFSPDLLSLWRLVGRFRAACAFQVRRMKVESCRDERFVKARTVNPKNFFAELKRRNVYKVAIAYAVVAWLLMQVATQVFPFLEAQLKRQPDNTDVMLGLARAYAGLQDRKLALQHAEKALELRPESQDVLVARSYHESLRASHLR